MSYKIVVDSCCELPDNLWKSGKFEKVPLGLEVGDYQVMDDDSFNQAEFLREVAAYPKCPKSSCPSPERFMQAYSSEEEHIYAVTLSSHLSGSHNSAVLGKSLYLEKYGKKDIHVVDSESASCGEAQIAIKIMELEEAGCSFEEVVETIEKFRDNMTTYFILDNLETLRKNGRLSGVKALVASTLNIKPVMGADKGVIIQRGQTIGMKKGLSKIAELVVKEVTDSKSKRLMITHCNAPNRAETLKNLILAQTEFMETIILDTAGISSMYANDGGVIVAV
ncbi:DegV family protein [Lachnospiraceae bacterium OttesenSCG-928-D06]|nr:DegV family protein [Lachnospiraceae bacterium OttesenSCG-928-D06]